MKVINSLKTYITVCIILLIGAISFSLKSVQAQSIEGIGAMVKGLNLDKPQLKKMIRTLEKAGKISKSQADQAIVELSTYTDEQIDGIKQQAVFKLENGLTKVPDMKKVKTIVKDKKTQDKLGNPQDPNVINADPEKAAEHVDLNNTLDYLNN